MVPNFRMIGLVAATAATLAVGALASSTSANAWGHGPWGGYHRGYYGPGPVFFGGGPAYGYGGPECFYRRKWVPGPWGWHKVVRRVCY